MYTHACINIHGNKNLKYNYLINDVHIIVINTIIDCFIWNNELIMILLKENLWMPSYYSCTWCSVYKRAVSILIVCIALYGITIFFIKNSLNSQIRWIRFHKQSLLLHGHPPNLFLKNPLVTQGKKFLSSDICFSKQKDFSCFYTLNTLL